MYREEATVTAVTATHVEVRYALGSQPIPRELCGDVEVGDRVVVVREGAGWGSPVREVIR